MTEIALGQSSQALSHGVSRADRRRDYPRARVHQYLAYLLGRDLRGIEGDGEELPAFGCVLEFEVDGEFSVLAMIFGQAFFLGSRGTLIYGLCAALGFHLFVVLYEEPALCDRFGAEYLAYCRQVRRWIPRWSRTRPV